MTRISTASCMIATTMWTKAASFPPSVFRCLSDFSFFRSFVRLLPLARLGFVFLLCVCVCVCSLSLSRLSFISVFEFYLSLSFSLSLCSSSLLHIRCLIRSLARPMVVSLSLCRAHATACV
jgi:hypothetical protein